MVNFQKKVLAHIENIQKKCFSNTLRTSETANKSYYTYISYSTISNYSCIATTNNLDITIQCGEIQAIVVCLDTMYSVYTQNKKQWDFDRPKMGKKKS